ncbi:conserved hypothetical protein [Desulfosarcina cetonica]|nr:conserved hypothetical protein [Desulfosarcina cetonica]
MAEWLINVTRRVPDSKACVVFIHGFQGDPATTWARFPELLCEDPNMGGWDVLSFGYKSHLAPDLTGAWAGDPSIKTIGDSLGAFARTNLVSRYGALVVIAHSMGGLVVQRSLLDHADLAEKVDKVILFGTPSFGLGKAWIFQLPILRSLNRQVRDMGRTSAFIKSLRSEWNDRFGKSPPFSFLAVAGSEDEFVPRRASIDGFPDDQCAVVPGNHLEIVKPKFASDASLGLVINFIQGQDVPGGRWSTAALALERRDFHKVAKQLGPNRAILDSRALVDLALALDGLGRRDEAMAVLSDAKRQGTDAMGVLAGRHKRNWFQDRVDQEARKALALYGEAYAIAKDKDAAQAYYHGINLAFLSLVYENDLAKAQDLAKKVLEHCANAEKEALPRERMWRLATEGEANLILRKIDIATQRFQSMLDGPPKPDPWQFTSTSQQALRIADQLGDEQLARTLLTLFTGG